MKKRWLITLLSAICALACAAFFGCDEGNTNDTGSASGSNTDLSSGGEDSSDSSSPDIYGPMSEITYETREYLANVTGANPDYEKAGERVTIATNIIIDADLWVYANGERIEQVPYDAAWWAYTFVMPDEPVHITFDVVSATYLNEFEPWLVDELSADDIAEIKETNEIAGIAPGHFITHYTVTDSEEIAELLPRYQSLSMRMCTDDCYVTGGLSREVTFTLKSGKTQTISFYQGLYMPDSFSSLTHFHVNTMPSAADYSNAVKSYSFITISGNCDIFEFDYSNGGEAHQVGEGTFLADLEFVAYHGAVPENLPTHYIIGEYFEKEYKIYVQDISLFFMWSGNGYGDSQITYYKVLDGVDLYALIQQSLWRDGGV